MPSQRELPLTIVYPEINKALRFYGAQAALSDQNLTLKIWGPFSPTDKDMAVSTALNFSDAGIVEILVDEANNIWDPVDIVNKADLAPYEHSGRPAVAFYGTPKRMCFSWDPVADQSRIRVSYDETVPDVATPQSAIFLPEYFAPMVGVRVARPCIAYILKVSPDKKESLDLRLSLLTEEKSEWEAEWKIKRFTSEQQGATRRLPFNRNRPGWRSMRRR